MNFGEGLTFPEENGLQLFGDSWNLATPVNTVAARSQQLLVEQTRVSSGSVQHFAGSVQDLYQNTQLGGNDNLLNLNVGLSNLESGSSSQYGGLLNQNGLLNHDDSLSRLNYDARATNHYTVLPDQIHHGLANSGISLSSQYHGLLNHEFTLSNQNTGMPNSDWRRLSNQCTGLSDQELSFLNGDGGFSNQNTCFSNLGLNLLTWDVGASNQNASSSNMDASFLNQNIASSNSNVGYSNNNANLSIREAGFSNGGVVFPNQIRSLSNQNSGRLNSYAGVSNQNVSLSKQISGLSNGDVGFLNRDISNYNMSSWNGDASISNIDSGLTNHGMGLLNRDIGLSNHNAVLSNRGVALSNYNMGTLGSLNHKVGVSNGNVVLNQSHQNVQLTVGNFNQSNQQVILPQGKRVIDHIANTCAQTPDNAKVGGNNITMADILAWNQSRHQSTDLLNNRDNHASMTEDGFPASNRPLYNLNSPPAAAHDDSIAGTSNPFYSSSQTQAPHQLHGILNHSEGEKLHQETKQDNLLVPPMGSEAIEKSNEELLQSDFQPSPVDVSSLDDTYEVNRQGIDLNKMPLQKATKRKKHRPRVVREGKSNRAQNPVTPQDSGTKQTPTAKRKYVRKNDQEYTTPKENATDKTGDPTVRATAKSCKRALNFDHDKSAGESHVLAGRTKEVDNISIVRNAESSKHSAPNGTSQWAGYGSVHQEQIHLDGSGQVLCQTNRTDENRDRSRQLMLQNSPQSVLHTIADSNEERGYKRKYQPIMDLINHEAATVNSLLYQEVINVDEYDEHLNNLKEGIAAAKKRRKFESEHTTNFPTFLYSDTGDSRQHTPNGINGVNPNLLTSQTNDKGLRSHLESSSTRRNICHGDNRFSLDQQNGNIKQHNLTQLVPYMPATENMKSKRSKSAKMPVKVIKGQSSKALLQEQNANHNPTSQCMNKGLSKRKKYLIDELTSKLECLQLVSQEEKALVCKEEKALVPYKADGAIVPYEESKIKKKQPRPKVNLDPESERLWKVLMGKVQAEASEGTDNAKEKYWEEERRVFRGRADLFITRMHRVQGDRRFSRWKGSVVDSVIGVYLTQNVTDHLSSSAFMDLSARFPIKSTNDNNPSCYRIEMPVMVKEPVVSILGTDDAVGHQEKVSHQLVYRQIPHVFQESFDQKGHDLKLRSERINLVESNDKIQEEVISATNSVHTFIHPTNGGLRMTSLTREEAEEQGSVLKPKQAHGSVPRNSVPPGARSKAQSTSHLIQQPSSSHQRNFKDINQQQPNNTQHEKIKDIHWKNTFTTGSVNNAEKVDARGIGNMQENHNTCNMVREASDTRTTFAENSTGLPNKKSEQKINEKKYSIGEATKGKPTANRKARKGKSEDAKKSEINWDELRKQVEFNTKSDRTADRMDSMDYEALRCAELKEISDTIIKRGMNFMLAERIKAFLNRLVEDHGSIDLEWLRDAPPDKAKEYLLSIRGLGLKSVECVRLLTLHHLAFPVDTNVGRIAVRLGWVPLQPLPEALQLHLLEMYPVLESVQKYLWPRLCKLDQRTLYELHYQMITFGKVFCTKSKPNCNACPMRGECRHFASAFASARLALPGPEEKGVVNSSFPVEGGRNPAVVINHVPLLTPAEDIYSRGHCEPIIEEPATPEAELPEMSEKDIEDAFYEDSEEIPTINLNVDELTQTLEYCMQESSQDGNMSKALIALNAAAASLPTPKLKNVSRLRTEHQVYELPDSHPLLRGMEKREYDDPSPYLLSIWAPDSTLPADNKCTSKDSNSLCDAQTCWSCNSKKEENSMTVRGTLLIPCRTAMRGSFPLNGTYFQVNEMFADDESSRHPIVVPRAWIWNLQRRTVYFGTSVTTIFRGLSTEGITNCFLKGFVCVRGFCIKERTSRPLLERLHSRPKKNDMKTHGGLAAIHAD